MIPNIPFFIPDSLSEPLRISSIVFFPSSAHSRNCPAAHEFPVLLVSLLPSFIFWCTQTLKSELIFVKKSSFLKVSYGRVRTPIVSIAETETTNCTKNQENGTISTQTINLGSDCLSSHLSPAFMIFIIAITIRMSAKMKYTTLETSIHISLR